MNNLPRYLIISILTAVIAAQTLFLVWLVKDIGRLKRSINSRVSLAESDVFKSAMDAMRQEIKEAKDIRNAIAQKPMVIRRAVPLSWYGNEIKVFDRLIGDGFLGGTTANGEILNAYDNTCATKDRTIPFDTILWLYVIETGKTSWCRKTDHAPEWATVEVDVNFKVATDLDIVYRGGGTAIVFW